ncbi:DUF6069 family protein [Dermacoccaceae bacterium W4C1]
MATHISTAYAQESSSPSWLRSAAVIAVPTGLVNGILLLAVTAGDRSDTLAPDGNTAIQVTPLGAVLATVLAVLIASGLARMAPRLPWATLGLAAGAISMAAPLLSAGSTTLRVALAAMHLLTGVVWFLVRRRAN